MVPATVARQVSEPSASLGDLCGRVPARLADAGATAGAKRRTTSTGSWSAMMSQARSNVPSMLGLRRLEASGRHATRRGSARS